MAEGGGAAVICRTCDGKGFIKVKEDFIKFTIRKRRLGIERVYDNCMGFRIGSKDVKRDDGTIIRFSKAGCSYKEWLKGAKPKPIKDLGCPYMHTNQGLQDKDVNNLYKTRCDKGSLLGKHISKCQFFNDKETCWRIFEEKKK